MSDIPVVCRKCGKADGVHQSGGVEITVDVWRNAKRLEWDTSKNALVVELGQRESEPSSWDIDTEIDEVNLDDAVWRCSHCGIERNSLDELVEPKYGVDRWGRVLDERGEPHGPMVVHPDQLALPVAA